MNNKTRGLIFIIGTSLILINGIVSLVISIPISAIYNDIGPNGIFGHVGIVNGIATLILGGFLLWLSLQNYSIPIRTIIGITC